MNVRGKIGRGPARTALAALLSTGLAASALAALPAATAEAAEGATRPPITNIVGTVGASSGDIAQALSYSEFNPDASFRFTAAFASALGQKDKTYWRSFAGDPPRDENDSPLITRDPYILRDVTTFAESRGKDSCASNPAVHSLAGTSVGSIDTPPLRAFLTVEEQARRTEFYTQIAADLQVHLTAAAAETTNADTRAALLAALPRAAALPNDALDNPAVSVEGLRKKIGIQSPNRAETYGTVTTTLDALELLGGVVRTTNFRAVGSISGVDGALESSKSEGRLRPTILTLPVKVTTSGDPRADFTQLALDAGGADLSAIEADLERIVFGRDAFATDDPEKRSTVVTPRLGITPGYELSPDRVVVGLLFGNLSIDRGSISGGSDGASVGFATGFMELNASQEADTFHRCLNPNPPPPPPPVEKGRITIDTFIPPKSAAGGPLVYRVECNNGYRERVEARGIRGERTSTTTGLIKVGSRCTVTPVANGNFGGEPPPPQDSFVPGRLLFRGPAYLPPTGDETYDPRDLGVGVAAAEAEDERIAETFEQPVAATPPPASWSDSCPTPRKHEPTLVIPRLRDCWRVGHDGLGDAALERGPQKYPGSIAPGRQGVAAIAAHRTSNGGMFYYLDRLREGDRIRLRTTQGTFTYEATRMDVVRPDNDTALKARGMGHRLVLTTCSGGVARRLVVQAVLLR